VRPYYNYKPLRDGWIRLLRIAPSSTDPNHISPAEVEKPVLITFEEHSLASCPPYIALSYTWGDATVTVDQTRTTFTTVPRCYPIFCDDQLLRGTRNLRDALRRLRQGMRTRAFSTYNESDFEKDALGDTDLYWIDALCVGRSSATSRRSRSYQVTARRELF
jgi:hypothetical protein